MEEPERMSSPTSRRQRRKNNARTPQQRRQQQQQLREQRLRQHAALHAPVDYSQDYAFIRHDLWRLTIWSSLLFAIMIAMSFFI